MNRFLTLGLILLLLATCGPLPSPEGTTGGADALLGEWVLTSLHGKPPLQGTQITLEFHADRVGGFAGCNAYGGGPDNGAYSIQDDGTLEIPGLARTLQACLEPEGVMEQEDAYLEDLTKAASYRVADDRLEIQDETGEAVLVFTRREAQAMDPADLVGTAWKLVTMDGKEPIGGSGLTLAFHGGGRASGYAGCRDYVMSYEADAAGLNFYYTGMMGPACDDEALLMQEGDYTTVLSWVDRYVLAGDRLELQSVRGEALVYEPLPAGAQPSLEGTTWTLFSFIEPNPAEDIPAPVPLSLDVLPGTEVTATFSDGQVAGSTGCNSYGGSYSLEAGSLAVGDLFQTEMACLEPEGVMEQESHYLDVLRYATQADVFGTRLWLETDDGRGLVFKPGG
ncbi:MAG: META domain-containing protein [Anaerolineae bacterium]